MLLSLCVVVSGDQCGDDVDGVKNGDVFSCVFVTVVADVVVVKEVEELVVVVQQIWLVEV